MGEVTLTPHQQTALDWLVMQLCDGAPLVALRGLAGTGKTTLIPALRDALTHQGLPTQVGSPTHRAAMILRRKGISDADTIHAHALTPYFTPDYAKAALWYGEQVPCRWDAEPHPDVDELPWLLHEYGKQDLAKTRATRRHAGRITARKLLASLGIHGKDCFAGFGPKEGQGVLIIDEASMVGTSMLALCQEAYKHVVLVGDPGQLPPVKDTAMLLEVVGVELTEIHRQAADSPIIQLAYRARNGEAFWQDPFTKLSPDVAHSDVVETALGPAEAFLESPLIVWRNEIRKTCTFQIRQALGFAKGALYVGEPLVCRSTSPEDRADGFYNNGLYRIVDVSAADPRLVTVEDALGETSDILVHIEELDGSAVPYQAIPFRFGYCLTAHTAQGGEWPTVYISVPDLLKYAGMCLRQGRRDEIAQWTYTAITRAKDTLCFLTQHHFERSAMAAPKVKDPMIAPPSTPMLNDWTPTAEDDIADPVVPTEALAETPQETAQDAPGLTQTILESVGQGVAQVLPEAKYSAADVMLHGLLEALQSRLSTFLREASVTQQTSQEVIINFLREWVAKQVTANEHAQIQLSDALYKLHEHGMVTAPPYTVQMHVVSPEGFPVIFTITKRETAALVEELDRVRGWLREEQYTPGEVRV